MSIAVLYSTFILNIGANSELRSNIQSAITIASSQNFLNRLTLFDLINADEYLMLKRSINKEKELNVHTDIMKLTTFLMNKLQNGSLIYHQRFKYFLGYYKDLKPLYFVWESLGKIIFQF